MAVSGVCSGGCGARFPGKFQGNLRDRLFPNRENASNSRIWEGHREGQTCREPWVDTALDLAPTCCPGCFSKLTVAAFSSFSEIWNKSPQSARTCEKCKAAKGESTTSNNRADVWAEPGEIKQYDAQTQAKSQLFIGCHYWS